ncbi:ISNCY family transposase [Candidatus Palauibacter sp.]|uniref:ISNCY family transposase n=1 Tax=Candidatus Palauibacter sp. TaxID=3101350 RepID=UPI003B5C44EE
MRRKRASQRSLFDTGYPDHEMGRTLERVSLILDGHPEFLDWIAAELNRGGRKSRRGRAGLACEVVLRCGILKQLWQSDYRDLEFALLDSASARHFARVDPLRPPKKSALQKTVGTVRAEVWERINRALLDTARGGRVETGRKARIDGTVTETHIPRPADNQLLRDGVRVLTRLMRRARKNLGDGAFRLHDHNRAAKRRCLTVSNGRGEDRVEAYRKLLAVVKKTLRYVPGALAAAEECGDPWAAAWREEVEHYLDLVERVIDQTERRVLGGETVPSGEKVVSLFEPHTDIIVKRGRAQYGHKLNLSTGGSGMVLDAVVERGNPADSSRCIPMIERHAELYGEAPAQVACDGGYASKANLREAKALGVVDMVFHKKRGLDPLEMASSAGVYGRLRRFRAGMEAAISYLKRCFGLRRCNWRGLEHFRAYVWSAIVTHNLVVLARSRLKLKPA